VLRWSSEKTAKPGRSIHFANAYTIALASKNPAYAATINSGDLTCCDGTPVVWAGAWLGKQQSEHQQSWERVYGPDVMRGVLAASTPDHKHFLLGSTPETLRELIAVIAVEFPNAQVVGSLSPPFTGPTAAELSKRDALIAETGANIVWVGLGTPKQDYEVARLARSLPVTALAVGAAFDFIAGTVAQAPTWMQRSGTEWVYRWGKEPKRLTKRYLWGNPTFVSIVVKQRFTN